MHTKSFKAGRFASSSCRAIHRPAQASNKGRCVATHVLRRDVLLSLPTVASLQETDPSTLANSILSAYGLPLLGKQKGFKAYEKDNSFVFDYPKGWIARANSQRPGVYISDFESADKAVVEILRTPDGADLVDLAVRAAVAPGAPDVTSSSDRLLLPSRDEIKVEERVVDGKSYTYLKFKSNTTTNSGYDIQRRNFVVATQRRGSTYVLVTSSRSDRYDDEKAKTLAYIVASFRVV